MLNVKVENQIAHLELNRPEARNALSPELIQKLTHELQELSHRKDVRVILLSGAGKVFCAGADLNTMQAMVNFSHSENKQDAQALFGLFAAMEACPQPVITSVQGAAYGGALGLIAVSDIVLVGDGTQFCFSEVKLGIAPAVISAFILKKISAKSVSPWMLSGRVFNAQEALRCGLVTEVVHGGLKESANAWTQSFLEAGPQAMAATKKLLQSSQYWNDPAAVKNQTTDLIAQLRVSSEGQEGLKSFLEKRSPSWKVKS
ncbi:MAG: enoyl-CoA hydratase-related protein [Proteobacteria bacterium]|nr:enoyl-CoA hydratase-related protein [Pseudomonadota bacterium]